jgi:hypothetical protein
LTGIVKSFLIMHERKMICVCELFDGILPLLDFQQFFPVMGPVRADGEYGNIPCPRPVMVKPEVPS